MHSCSPQLSGSPILHGGAAAIIATSIILGKHADCNSRPFHELHEPKGKRPPRGRLYPARYELEPIHQPCVHAHVVLVANSAKAKHHPVELDCPDGPFPFAVVHAAAEVHRHPAIAYPATGSAGAAKQSMRKRREVL